MFCCLCGGRNSCSSELDYVFRKISKMFTNMKTRKNCLTFYLSLKVQLLSTNFSVDPFLVEFPSALLLKMLGMGHM